MTQPSEINPNQPAGHSNGEAAILAAAETLFAEKGFNAVSMSAIASLANTSKPNIYHHFKNKDELYLAIVKKAVRRTTGLLDAIEDQPGSYGQHLVDFSAGHLENILEQDKTTRLILREALFGNSNRGREIAKHMVNNIFIRLIAMVEKGQLNHEFRKDVDPSLIAFMIISANSFFFQSRPLMQNVPEAEFINDPGNYSAGVMDVLFRGLLTNTEDKS